MTIWLSLSVEGMYVPLMRTEYLQAPAAVSEAEKSSAAHTAPGFLVKQGSRSLACGTSTKFDGLPVALATAVMTAVTFVSPPEANRT